MFIILIVAIHDEDFGVLRAYSPCSLIARDGFARGLLSLYDRISNDL